MRELNVNEIEQVNGGIPLFIAIPAAYAVRKYGGRMVAGAIGAVLGWMSEP
jgi:hypothetical protein